MIGHGTATRTLYLSVSGFMAFKQGNRTGWRLVRAQELFNAVEVNALVLVPDGARVWKASPTGFSYCRPLMVDDDGGVRMACYVGCQDIASVANPEAWVKVDTLPAPPSEAELTEALAVLGLGPDGEPLARPKSSRA